jgi:hypothetical protein
MLFQLFKTKIMFNKLYTLIVFFFFFFREKKKKKKKKKKQKWQSNVASPLGFEIKLDDEEDKMTLILL